MTTKERVKQALTENESFRDSDALLVTHLWREDLIVAKMEYKPYYMSHYLALVENKVLTNHDSITRERRDAQHDYPHLRGDVYNKRHGLAEQYRINYSK